MRGGAWASTAREEVHYDKSKYASNAANPSAERSAARSSAIYSLSARIGDEQQARGMTPTVTAATFWLWDVLGIFIIVGPLVYFYKLLHAMNDLSADYNARG